MIGIYILKDYDYSIEKLLNKEITLTIDPNFKIDNYFLPLPSEKLLDFRVYSDISSDPKQIYDDCMSFIQNDVLGSAHQKPQDQISVYTINFNRIETVKEEPNPVFLEWEEQVNHLKTLANPKSTFSGENEPGQEGGNKSSYWFSDAY